MSVPNVLEDGTCPEMVRKCKKSVVILTIISSFAALEIVIVTINTLRLRQDGRHFPDDILKCIFLNENVWISLTISLRCVRKVRINNIPSLVQIMAWRRPGDKPLSGTMMVSLLTHICVTRPQWVNFYFIDITTVLWFLHILGPTGILFMHCLLSDISICIYGPLGIFICCKTSNINHTLVGNEIVDHSDVVGASPVGAATTTSSFST